MKNNQPPPLGWPDRPLITGQQAADIAVVSTLLAALALGGRAAARTVRRFL